MWPDDDWHVIATGRKYAEGETKGATCKIMFYICSCLFSLNVNRIHFFPSGLVKCWNIKIDTAVWNCLHSTQSPLSGDRPVLVISAIDICGQVVLWMVCSPAPQLPPPQNFDPHQGHMEEKTLTKTHVVYFLLRKLIWHLIVQCLRKCKL